MNGGFWFGSIVCFLELLKELEGRYFKYGSIEFFNFVVYVVFLIIILFVLCMICFFSKNYLEIVFVYSG